MLTVKTLLVSEELVNKAHRDGCVQLEQSAATNSYAILRSERNRKHTAFVFCEGQGVWRKIKNTPDLIVQGLSPRDSRQSAFLNSLTDPEILISIAIGEAGTGKTTLALAYAVDQYMSRKTPILLSKPTSMVGDGRAFGPVPGDVADKYAPYLASYEIALKRILGKYSSGDYLKKMRAAGDLQYIPIELVRGSEFPGCTFVLDEAQNLTWHELKSLISRMGNGTKIIVLGDLEQIDTGARKEDTGLFRLVNSLPFQKSRVGSAIQLKAQYRSPITALVADVDKWIKGKQHASIPDDD